MEPDYQIYFGCAAFTWDIVTGLQGREETLIFWNAFCWSLYNQLSVNIFAVKHRARISNLHDYKIFQVSN